MSKLLRAFGASALLPLLAALLATAPQTASAQITVAFGGQTGDWNNMGDITLDFSVDGSGDVFLDASSTGPGDATAIADLWDGMVGSVDIGFAGAAFSMSVTSPDRLQATDNGSGIGGLGIQGRNQWRLDDMGLEQIDITADEFIDLSYTSFTPTNIGAGDGEVNGVNGANFVISDVDTTVTHEIATTDVAIDISGFGYDVAGGDSLTFSTESGRAVQAGGSLHSITFDITAYAPPAVARVNRDTGVVTLEAGIDDIVFSSYSITSGAGTLVPDNWDSLTDGATNGSLDSDAWIKLSEDISNGTAVSEAELPGVPSTPGYTIPSFTTLNLGDIWGKNPTEDVVFQVQDDAGAVTAIAVVFEGNGGAPQIAGDFDFDDDVDLQDFAIFQAGFGGVFAGMSGGETYALGDLNTDLDVDINDFRAFEALYNAANPITLAQALAAPEPTTLGLVLIGSVAAFSLRRRAGALLILGAATLGIAAGAEAQTFTVIEGAANSANNVSTNSTVVGGLDATGLFDVTVSGSDVDVSNLNSGVEFQAQGAGPHTVFFDYSSPFTANFVGYQQRTNNDDHWADAVEVWVQDEAFGGVLPTREPDAVAVFDELEGNLFKSFQLSSPVSGSFVAINLLDADSAFLDAGGHEFRFLQGPDEFILEVNTLNGDVSLKNTGANAQALVIDAYQIGSAAGSLSAGGYTGLAPLSGFDAASSSGAGDGWEVGGSSGANLITDGYLLGGSTVSIGEDLDLGTGYDTSVDAQDLTFAYSLQDGRVLNGAVEYITGPTGDYNNDGAVDAADYTVWRDNLGADSSVLKNTEIVGEITTDHYEEWRTNFGETVGGGSLAAATPEPMSGLLALFGATAGIAFRRGRKPGATELKSIGADETMHTSSFQSITSRATAVVAFAAALLLAGQSSASTPDRLYFLGDNYTNPDTLETTTENGASNIGNVIGSQTGTTFDGFSLDAQGSNANFQSYADLTPAGDPRYADVSDAGTQRPGTAGAGVLVGAEFDGDGDYLFSSPGFGNPQEADDAYEDVANYATLINHYMQGWVYPTSAGIAGQRQTVVQETSQFKIHLDTDADGVMHWTHHHYLTTQPTDVEAPLNEWTHVAQYATGGAGVLYVNGVAEGIINGYYQVLGAAPDQSPGGASMVLGAELTGDLGSLTESNFFTGQLDDFDVRVTGDNSDLGLAGTADYGAFNIEEDNAYVANLVADGTLVPGDVNGDGIVNGNGLGSPESDDVAFFVDHFLDQKVVDGFIVGDLETRTTMADLNYSGTTNLFDWAILVANHSDTAVVASLDLGALLAGTAVPEPTSYVLIAAASGLLVGRRQRQR